MDHRDGSWKLLMGWILMMIDPGDGFWGCIIGMDPGNKSSGLTIRIDPVDGFLG